MFDYAPTGSTAYSSAPQAAPIPDPSLRKFLPADVPAYLVGAPVSH